MSALGTVVVLIGGIALLACALLWYFRPCPHDTTRDHLYECDRCGEIVAPGEER